MVEQYPHKLYIDQLSDHAQDPDTGNWEAGGVPFEPQIGDEYQGGKIFYIDSTGKHGLICTVSSIGTFAWAPTHPAAATLATDPDVGAGDENTNKILDTYGVGTYAAAACKIYSGGGYNDWHLPSKNELQLMVDAGIVTSLAWSSTEQDDDYTSAWHYNPYTLMQGVEKFEEIPVFAIRQF